MKIRKILNHGRVRWRLDYSSAEGRIRRFFSAEAEAKKFASERKEEEAEYGKVFAAVGPRSRLLIGEQLKRLGDAGASLEEAIDFFLEHRTDRRPPALQVAVDQCLEAKRLANKRPRYLASLKSTLLRFAKGRETLNAAKVTTEMVQAWLTNNAWAAATQRSYLTDLRTLFSFCIARGYLRFNPAAGIEKPELDDKPPGILTRAQASALLQAAKNHQPRLVAAIAINLFAGLRPVEISKLTWEEIGPHYILVAASKAKSRRRRLVRIEPNLRAWLRLKGDLPPKNWKKRFDDVREKAEVTEWPHDAMRHSFASYHLARGRSADKTAHELGHGSTQMLFGNYRELVSHAEGKRFFQIKP